MIATGIAICYVSFGRDFFLNILAPRHYSLKKAIRSYKDLQWVLVGLVACVCNGCAEVARSECSALYRSNRNCVGGIFPGENRRRRMDQCSV